MQTQRLESQNSNLFRIVPQVYEQFSIVKDIPGILKKNSLVEK